MRSTKHALNFLWRKTSSDSADTTTTAPPVAPQQRSMMQSMLAKTPEESMPICHGEYATIRHGIRLHPPSASSTRGRSVPTDHRVGIITLHSVDDPELLQLCASVAAKTTPRSVSQSSPPRTLVQYSGIIVYPVVDDADESGSYLEVVVKLSCFDPRGLSPQKKASMLSYVAGFRNLAHMMLVMRLRSSPFLAATHWVADERRKCCLVCQQRFSSLRRRHHCRLCGEVTCSRCSAVHQVRLVREAKASLRICLLCVQGVDKPKWKDVYDDLDHLVDEDVDRTHPTPRTHPPPQHQPPRSVDENDEQRDVETEPAFLLDFSLVKELSKPPSPTSTATDMSSPVDPLMQSHASSLSSTVDMDSTLAQSTFSAFHDSAYEMTFQKPDAKATRKTVPADVASLHDSMIDFHGIDDEEEDEEEDEEQQYQPQYEDEQPVLVVEAVDEQVLDVTDEDDVDDVDEEIQCGMTRIMPVDASGDVEEDEDDQRLHCLLAYGLLDDGSVIPEDLTLQIIVKEAAQLVDCAIAAISFVDASRDMVTATYSASPLCQVSRGVIPKQHSLSWQVMERSAASSTTVVVLDTLQDAVLKKSPFVLDEPYVRFMIGLPIRSWTGVPIGAMMLADIQPRHEITRSDLRSLQSHVALVESWLESRRHDGIAMNKATAGATTMPSTISSLENRLAEMLCTSYKTTLQMRGMQQKQMPPSTTTATATPPATTTSTQLIQRVLF